MMNWTSLVAQLYGLRRFGIEPGLESMRRALAAEGHPDGAYDVITVAGTNGKGTVASMTAAILQAKGLRVGLYTSPHLIDVTERFRVDGVPLSRRVVAPVLRQLIDEHGRQYNDRGEAEGLTFFELTTLTAATLFRDCGVDVAVFEVGLGGRLDAVNALEPAVTAVTTIGRDHTRYLGTRIEDIAEEKAGIFRNNVPAVIGEQEFPAAQQTLSRKADAIDAPIVEANREEGWRISEATDIERRHCRTAVHVCRSYAGGQMTASDIERGLQRWRWPGRFEKISLEGGERRLWVDAAHNRAGLEALRHHWAHRLDAVDAAIWTTMSDKEPGDVEGFFTQLGVPVWGGLVDNPRGSSPAQLEAYVPSGLWRGAVPTGEALEEATGDGAGDILVFGSIFLIGELFDAIERRAVQLQTYAVD